MNQAIKEMLILTTTSLIIGIISPTLVMLAYHHPNIKTPLLVLAGFMGVATFWAGAIIGGKTEE
jgi:hypothetical protein